MGKKTKKILFILVFVSGAVAGYWWYFTQKTQTQQVCAFCSEAVLKNQTFYEDDFVMGLTTHKPVEKGHCLVVTKRHIETLEEMSDEEFLATGRLLKKINKAIQKIHGPSSYLILQKNGGEVGQTVPHAHFHYIPKRKKANKGIALFGLLWKFVITIFKSPISKSKLVENTERMKKELLS